jgi:hypothetical protein
MMLRIMPEDFAPPAIAGQPKSRNASPSEKALTPSEQVGFPNNSIVERHAPMR